MEPIRGFSLAAVVLLSLVLPFAAKVWLPVAEGRKSYLATVWAGQLLGAVGGLWIIAAPVHPEFGLVFAVVSCLACLPILRRQFRPV
jgi:hypothetical protein